jgi:molybdate transport system substrate-binding protein
MRALIVYDRSGDWTRRDPMLLRAVLLAALIAAFTLTPNRSYSAEIKVLSANGMREVMLDLGPKFQAATGHTLSIAFATLGVIVKRIQDGEASDVVIVPRQGIDRLVQDGKANGATVTVLARSGIGVIVRKDAPKPDISTPEAFKRALLAAKSVTYLDPAAGGTTGVHFEKVIERLAIAEEIKRKAVLHPNAKAAAALVANGEAEIGLNLIQELMPLPGIEIVGPLPADLQLTLVFAAAVMNGSGERAAAEALLGFLRTPDAAAVIRTKGMDPAS